MNTTKAKVVATTHLAINTPAPGLISFRHVATITDEVGYKCYLFEVCGVPFETGFSDPEHYSFLDNHLMTTSALTIRELKVLLWWLEQGDTKVFKAPKPRGAFVE
jgi:hypothetical protein